MKNKNLNDRYEELVKPQVYPLMQEILKLKNTPVFKVTSVKQTAKERKEAKQLKKFLQYFWQKEQDKIIKSILHG